MPTQLAVLETTLSDKSLVSTFNANRFDDSLKWRSELQYALKIIRGNEQLRDCEPESIKLSMLEVAYSGLTLAPSLGHGYLIPYGKVCTFSPGYKGILHLVYKGGTLKSVQPGLHKPGDPKWRVWTDEAGKHIEHEEGPDAARSAKPTQHAYVIARFTSGDRHIEVMDAEQLGKIEFAATHKRARDDSGKSVWVDNPKGGMVWRGPWRSQMEIKSVIRRASSYWPRDNGGMIEHALAVLDKHEPVEFESEPRADEPTELLITAEQQLELHAALTDRDLPGEEANEWLRLKAIAMGYGSIMDLPARLVAKAKADLLERLTKVQAAARG